MKPHSRGEHTSKRKALAAIAACTAALCGLVYRQWPFFEFWILMVLINF